MSFVYCIFYATKHTVEFEYVGSIANEDGSRIGIISNVVQTTAVVAK